MIPKNIKMQDCVGKYATVDRNIMNGAGQCIAKGARVRIINCARSLDIETEKCLCCGQYCRIRGVKKEVLTLINEGSNYNE